MALRVLFVIFVLGLVSCVQPELVPCGDQLCPAGASCIADRCVQPEQLEACGELAGGDSCVVFGAAGRCVDGACTVTRCGNSVLDPGEVCDDGNVADGDGCRRDCLSDGSCGNGLLDPQESCDCGRDDATRPEGCVTVNADAIDALCDTSCSRRCGDGMVTGPEACDGLSVPATCTQFGYYTGSVSCTPFCTLDDGACSGRCGDDIVQANEGESCDGAPPVGASCFGFGRDYGTLGCNRFCSPDISRDCAVFGWSLEASGVMIRGANLNRHGFIVLDPPTVSVQFDGVKTTLDATGIDHVAATPDAFLALGPATTLRYDHTGWTTFGSLGAIVDSVADGSDLYVIDAACTIQRLDVASGLATTHSSPVLSGCTSIDVVNGAIVVANGAASAIFDGSWRAGPTAVQIAWTEAPRRAAVASFNIADEPRLDEVELATGDTTYVSSTTQLATSITGAIIDDGTGDDAPSFLVKTAGFRGTLAGPGPEQDVVVDRDGDGSLFVRDRRQVFRLGPTWITAPARAVSLQADGSLAWCIRGEPSLVGDLSMQRVFPGSACNSVVGPVGATHYVGSSGGLYRFDVSTNQYVVERAGIWSVVADATTLWASSAASGLLRLEAGVWVNKPNPTGCSLRTFAASASGGVVGAFQCNSVDQVYRFANDTWTQLPTPPTSYNRIVLARDGALLAFGPTGFARFDGTTWTAVPLGAQAHAYAARTATDVYYLTGDTLHHWDGSASSPIRIFSTTTSSSNHLIAMPDGLVYDRQDRFGVLAWFGPQSAGL